MPDRTGRAIGTLSPAIYFENSSGHILLPPVDVEDGLSETRRLYDVRFKSQGYEWREADTWPALQRLQKRLVEQEERILQRQGQADYERRERRHKEINSRLAQRMASGSTDPWERDFIRLWMELRADKQEEFTKRYTERNMYLWACEMNSNTLVQDRIGSD